MEIQNKLGRVMAVLTAYNDEEKVERCLSGILDQTIKVQSIFVIDNSPQSLFFEGNLKKVLAENRHIIVEHHPENIGISGAILRAQELAIYQEHDWVWFFDQDSLAQPDALAALATFYSSVQEPDSIGVLACLPVDPEYGHKFHGINYNGINFTLCLPSEDTVNYDCDVVITAGTLASLRALTKSEAVDERLFIDAVDYDFCLKIRKAGFRVIVVQSALVHQPIGEPTYVDSLLLRRKVRCSNHSALRKYYISRNNTYLELSLCSVAARRTVMKWRLRSTVEMLIEAMHEKTDRLSKVYNIIMGFWHGVSGRLGKLN